MKPFTIGKHLLAVALTLGLITTGFAATGIEESDFDRYFKGYHAGFVLLDVQTGQFTRYHPEIVATRHSPCSTFKIPNSLIGLETRVVPDVDTPWKWDGVTRPIVEWNKDQTMRSAIEVSCVPYYQDLAAKIGPQRMKKYLSEIHYGNEDISGGQTQFWLQSTLKISAEEQAIFLRKLALGQLPFSKRTLDLVREITLLSKSADTELHGKTGTGVNPPEGWFVGYVIRNGKTYAFATILVGGEDLSGKNAKKLTLDLLRGMNFL